MGRLLKLAGVPCNRLLSQIAKGIGRAWVCRQLDVPKDVGQGEKLGIRSVLPGHPPPESFRRRMGLECLSAERLPAT